MSFQYFVDRERDFPKPPRVDPDVGSGLTDFVEYCSEVGDYTVFAYSLDSLSGSQRFLNNGDGVCFSLELGESTERALEAVSTVLESEGENLVYRAEPFQKDVFEDNEVPVKVIDTLENGEVVEAGFLDTLNGVEYGIKFSRFEGCGNSYSNGTQVQKRFQDLKEVMERETGVKLEYTQSDV